MKVVAKDSAVLYGELLDQKNVNINLKLVSEGLATISEEGMSPENLMCYKSCEHAAIVNNIGLWNHEDSD